MPSSLNWQADMSIPLEALDKQGRQNQNRAPMRYVILFDRRVNRRQIVFKVIKQSQAFNDASKKLTGADAPPRIV